MTIISGIFGILGFMLLCCAVVLAALQAKYHQLNKVNETISREMEESTDITDAVEIVDEK